jgi:hypothetical protein
VQVHAAHRSADVEIEADRSRLVLRAVLTDGQLLDKLGELVAVMAPLLLLSSIPLFGLFFGWLKIIVIGVLALCSSLLGVLYVANYNKKGRRTALSENTPEAKLPI